MTAASEPPGEGPRTSGRSRDPAAGRGARTRAPRTHPSPEAHPRPGKYAGQRVGLAPSASHFVSRVGLWTPPAAQGQGPARPARDPTPLTWLRPLQPEEVKEAAAGVPHMNPRSWRRRRRLRPAALIYRRRHVGG